VPASYICACITHTYRPVRLVCCALTLPHTHTHKHSLSLSFSLFLSHTDIHTPLHCMTARNVCVFICAYVWYDSRILNPCDMTLPLFHHVSLSPSSTLFCSMFSPGIGVHLYLDVHLFLGVHLYLISRHI